jgi:hypothetical protein
MGRGGGAARDAVRTLSGRRLALRQTPPPVTQSAPGRPTAARGAGLVYRTPPPWTPRPSLLSGSSQERRHARPPPEAELAASARAAEQESWPSLPKDPLVLRPVEVDLDPESVPPLAHGLDIVLRERGVFPMAPVRQQKRGLPHRPNGSLHTVRGLRRIAQPHEVDWLSIPPYTRASDDPNLRTIARREGDVRYSGSTSSMTSALSVLYHAVSNFSDTLLTGGLTRSMSDLPCSFTKHHNRPTAVAVRPYPPDDASPPPSQRRLFSIDMHAGKDSSPSILRDLGHSMERMLTMDPEEFRAKVLLKDLGDAKVPVGNEGYMDAAAGEARRGEVEPQFYHYSRADQFLLRAQIDCRDPRTGDVFDLKTRAVARIRYNIDEYKSNANATLAFLTGAWHSYEREFYDMVRSVFLKYALQVRIGRMSGAFVTYHNTARVLGFEFVPLAEMEAYVFGGRRWADTAFSSIIRVLGLVLDEVTAAQPVEYPGYIKIVLVPSSNSRSVQVYAQRVRDPDGDPLDQAKFTFGPPRAGRRSRKPRSTLVGGDDEGGSSVSDGDDVGSDGDVRKRPGVAFVGASTCMPMGGLPPPQPSAATGSERRGKHSLEAMRDLAREAFADRVRGEFGEGDVLAWNMCLAPVVNGVTTRHPFSVGEGDTFELKYHLSRSKHDGERVLRDFVQVLDATYNAHQ